MAGVVQAVASDPAQVKMDFTNFQWQNVGYQVPYEVYGSAAKSVVMLPAISTVSSRSDLEGLATKLSSKRRCVLSDWVGYGNSDRLGETYSADMCSQYAQDLLTGGLVGSTTFDLVAAGHAPGIVVHALTQLKAQGKMPSVGKLVLLAPTIHGPFRVMGLSDTLRGTIRSSFETPVLGELMYRGISSTPSVKRSYKSHVLVNEAMLTDDFVNSKTQIAQKSNARFGVAAFITGGLDFYPEPEQFGKAVA